MIGAQKTLSQFSRSEVCPSHELVEATHNYHVPVREHLGGAYLGPTLRSQILVIVFLQESWKTENCHKVSRAE